MTTTITTALTAASIDYRVEHGSTLAETVVVRRVDGREVAIVGTSGGIDVAYHMEGTDSEVRTQDCAETTAQLVEDLRAFLS